MSLIVRSNQKPYGIVKVLSIFFTAVEKNEADSRQSCSYLMQVDGATHRSTGTAFFLHVF